MTALIGTRLSDRLHPILVRDVKQAVRGRVYTLAVVVSCISVLTIGLLAVDRDRDAIELSRWTLVTSMQCLAPLVLFAVPLMAFLSLREEITEHTADQLILTRMRPLSIIAGMLLAALALALLFVAMFVPLLAFSYLLLGVDVPTLLQCGWLALCGCALATSVAFALIRLRRFRVVRDHVALIVAAVLGWFTVDTIVGMEGMILALEANARSPQFPLIALQQLTMIGLATVFFALTGAGCLTHIQENRATSFRILGVVAAPTLTLFFGAGMRGAALASLGLAPFWFLAVTDPLQLSRRHRALVPTERRDKLRMLPFLPGSGRGLVYTSVLAAVVLVSGLVTHPIFLGRLPTGTELVFGVVGIEFMLLYAAAFCWMRNHWFEQHRLTSSIARLRLPGLTLLAWLGCLIVDALFVFTTRMQVFPLSAFNPIVTLQTPLGSPGLSAVVLAVPVVWLAIKNAADVRASVREVLHGQTPPVAEPVRGRWARRRMQRRNRRR